jgi:hypothetical protein
MNTVLPFSTRHLVRKSPRFLHPFLYSEKVNEQCDERYPKADQKEERLMADGDCVRIVFVDVTARQSFDG